MNSPKEKKPFDWESGSTLDDKEYQPLGNVRSKGLPKIIKAVAADPEQRKKEREIYVTTEQQKNYRKKSVSPKDEELLIEESKSGLSHDIEDSVARKLIGNTKGSKVKGVDRFGKK